MKNLKKNKTNKSGRKLFDGKNEVVVLSKLEEAFAIGASDEEACLYADISVAALQRYQKKNVQFRQRKELLKQRPVLEARKTVVKALKLDADLALKYLERKKKDEFSTKQEIQVTDREKINDSIAKIQQAIRDAKQPDK